MIKINQIIAAMFLTMVFISCGEDMQRPDGIILFEDGSTFIELVNVEDSRCPADVTCVWEGNAGVFMRISQDESQQEFTLNSNPGENTGVKETELFGYNIELIDVSPFPTAKTTGNISLEEYVIDLKVTQ